MGWTQLQQMTGRKHAGTYRSAFHATVVAAALKPLSELFPAELRPVPGQLGADPGMGAGGSPPGLRWVNYAGVPPCRRSDGRECCRYIDSSQNILVAALQLVSRKLRSHSCRSTCTIDESLCR